MKHEIIPVPEEVLLRQERIRDAREIVHQMYGIPAMPYEMGTPEYEYFKEMLLA